MIDRETLDTINVFVRRPYWMFYLGNVTGFIEGIFVAVGAWYAVQKLQEWRERHNYETWRKFRRAA